MAVGYELQESLAVSTLAFLIDNPDLRPGFATTASISLP
jgi:hypothetical protein